MKVVILLLSVLLLFPSLSLVGGSSSQPSMSSEELFYLETVAEAEATRNQMIHYIRNMLTKVKRQNIRADLNLKLMKAYSGQYLYYRRKEHEHFNARYDVWKQTRKGPEPTKPSHKDSDQYRENIIVIGSRIIQQYPKFGQLDDVYFLLAYVLQMKGDTGRAAGYYQKIIRDFPNSKRRFPTYFALGEYMYGKRKFKSALSYYKKVAQGKDESLKLSAWYKIGWCFFNLSDYDRSLSAFKHVVSVSSESSKHGLTANKFVKFREESLRDMVSVYAEIGRVNDAKAYFYSVGGEKYYRDMLLRYGEALIRNGHLLNGVKAIKLYMNLDPIDPGLPDQNLKIIAAVEQMANKEYLYQELAEFADRFKTGSIWGKKNRNDPNLISDTHVTIHRVFLNKVQKIHTLAQKHQDESKYQIAFKGYQKYIEFFPTSPKVYEVSFFLAEIRLRQAEKLPKGSSRQEEAYLEAARLYTYVVKQGLKLKYFKVSAEAMILASTAAFAREWRQIRKQSYRYNIPSQSLSAGANQFVAACRQYINWQLGSKMTLQCYKDIAEIFIKTGNFDSAEKILWDLLSKYPQKTVGQAAGGTILSIHEKRSDLDSVIGKMTAIPGIANTRLGRKLREYNEKMILDEAAKLEKQGHYVAAATKYLNYHDRYKTAGSSEKVLYNAAINFEKAKLSQQALGLYLRFLSAYPRSTYKKQVTIRTAVLQETLFYLLDAANTYLQLYYLNKRSNQAKSYLYNAFVLYASVDKRANAEQMVKLISYTAPRSTEFRDMLLQYLEQMRRDKNHRQVIKIGRRYLPKFNDPDTQIILWGKVAHAYQQLGDSKNQNYVFRLITKIGNSRKLSLEARGSYAEAVFVRALAHVGQVTRSKLKANRLNETVDKMLKVLNRVNGEFDQVFKIGDATWSVATFYELGIMYDDVAQRIAGAPLPRKLNENTRKVVRDTLQQKIETPLRQKSHSYFLEGDKLAKRLNVYTPYAEKLHRKVSQINKNPIIPFDKDDLLPLGIVDGIFFERASIQALF